MSARRFLFTSVLVLSAFGIAQADPKPKPKPEKKPGAAVTAKKPAAEKAKAEKAKGDAAKC